MILREAGNPEFALTKLEENAQCIFDRLSYHETRGGCSLTIYVNIDNIVQGFSGNSNRPRQACRSGEGLLELGREKSRQQPLL